MPVEAGVTTDRLSSWTDEEARRFLSSARRSPCGPYWSLRLATGLGADELLALRREDVDWDNGAVSVWRMLDHGWGWRGPEVIPNDQRRMIHVKVPDAVMAQLQAHRRAQREFRLAAGPAWQERGLLLTTTTGAPASVRFLTHELGRIIEQANVPRIPTSAVLRVDALAPISVGERRSAAEVIGGMLFGDRPRRPPAT